MGSGNSLRYAFALADVSGPALCSEGHSTEGTPLPQTEIRFMHINHTTRRTALPGMHRQGIQGQHVMR